jgi:hypothetical protein
MHLLQREMGERVNETVLVAWQRLSKNGAFAKQSLCRHS